MNEPSDAAKQAAELFHDTYERLAPSFGYETRKDTRKFDPNSPNGRLMIAVCSEVLGAATAKLREELKFHKQVVRQRSEGLRRSIDEIDKAWDAGFNDCENRYRTPIAELKTDNAKLREAVEAMPHVAYNWIFVDAKKIDDLPNELQCIADAALAPKQ